MLMMTIIAENRERANGLLPLMKRFPGLSYDELSRELGMKKKAVMNKMDRLQLRGVVWFRHEQRLDKHGVSRKTRIWFTEKEVPA